MHLFVIISFCTSSADIKTEKKPETFNITLLEQHYTDGEETKSDFMIKDPKLLCPKNTSTPKISPATSECSRESSFMDSINRPPKSPKKNIKNIERRRSLRSIPRTESESTHISSNDEKIHFDFRHPTKNMRKRKSNLTRTLEKSKIKTHRWPENPTYILMDGFLRRKEKKMKKAKNFDSNLNIRTGSLENKNFMKISSESCIPIAENDMKDSENIKCLTQPNEIVGRTLLDSTYYSCKEENKIPSIEIPKTNPLDYFKSSDASTNEIKQFLYKFINNFISYCKETKEEEFVKFAIQSIRTSELFSETECNTFRTKLKAKFMGNQSENSKSSNDFLENSLDNLDNSDELNDMQENQNFKKNTHNTSRILYPDALNNNSSYNSTNQNQKPTSKVNSRENKKQTIKMKIKKILQNTKIIIILIISTDVSLIFIFVKYYKVLLE